VGATTRSQPPSAVLPQMGEGRVSTPDPTNLPVAGRGRGRPCPAAGGRPACRRDHPRRRADLADQRPELAGGQAGGWHAVGVGRVARPRGPHRRARRRVPAAGLDAALGRHRPSGGRRGAGRAQRRRGAVQPRDRGTGHTAGRAHHAVRLPALGRRRCPGHHLRLGRGQDRWPGALGRRRYVDRPESRRRPPGQAGLPVPGRWSPSCTGGSRRRYCRSSRRRGG
jgi:hypothetical protein